MAKKKPAPAQPSLKGWTAIAKFRAPVPHLPKPGRSQGMPVKHEGRFTTADSAEVQAWLSRVSTMNWQPFISPVGSIESLAKKVAQQLMAHDALGAPALGDVTGQMTLMMHELEHVALQNVGSSPKLKPHPFIGRLSYTEARLA
jgi:hypothetical protein